MTETEQIKYRELLEFNRDHFTTPKIGDYVIPDRWNGLGGKLMQGDEACGSTYPGSQFRMKSAHFPGNTIAVNITVTSTRRSSDGSYRCQIEFVGAGEPSTLSGGRIMFRWN